MFPNFSSLSQRQSKKQSLFDKAERNIQIENAKKAAYQGALWASDIEKNKISLVKSTTTKDTQTEGTDTQTDTQTDGRDDPANEPRDRAPTFATDIGNEDDTVSEFDDVEDPQSEPIDEENDFDNEEFLQQQAYQVVKEQLESNPELALMAIHPIKKASNGQPPELFKTVFLGKNAELRNSVSGRRISDPDIINWALTKDIVIERFNSISRFTANVSRDRTERDLRRAVEGLRLNAQENKAESERLERKRHPKGQLQGPPIKMSRFEPENASTDAAQDEATARENLLEFYRENKEELDRMVVSPINKENNIMSGFKVALTLSQSHCSNRG